MANEGIRLPSDTTVASQKVHRGTTAQDTQITKSTSKEVPANKTLATVVLQAKPLIEGSRGGLFELVVQNDPKSEPPIRLQSDTLLKPGTPILIERGDNNEYRPVDKPTQQQLTQLVQLELDYWRAHLLPKAGNRAFPTLPDSSTLLQLAQQIPSLKPLIHWLNQRPQQITGEIIQRFLQETSPLTQRRDWAVSNAQTAASNLRTEPQSTSSALAPERSNTSVLPSMPPIRLPHPLLTLPVGMRSPSVAALALLNAAGIGNAAKDTPLPTRGWQFTGQAFQIAQNSTPIPAKVLHASLIPARWITGGQTTAQSGPGATVPNPAVGQLSPSMTTTSPGSTAGQTQMPAQRGAALPNSNVAANSFTVNGRPLLTLAAMPTVKGEANNTLTVTSWPSATQNSEFAVRPSRVASSDVAQPQFRSLPPTPGAEGFTSRTLPLEVRLSMWLSQIDQTIQRQPVPLQQQVQAKAQSLLNTLSQSPIIAGPAASAGTGQTDSSREEPALLALRNWLDATQARLQLNTVQLATHQVAQPEPPVQQMQLPLIWLGLTGWADMEWWQERPKNEHDKKKERKAKQSRWRMKIYLTLEPLSKVCADLDWSVDHTQLTLWSEDAATLNHLNQLLPTLNQWTDGLGERQLSTKHGMPAKRSAPTEEESASHHLVDIKT